MTMCLSPGRVMCQKRRQVLAPSTEAASYSSGRDALHARQVGDAEEREAAPPVGDDHRQHGALGRGHEGERAAQEPASISTLLKKPRPGKASNIQRQVRAMITVDVIQGSRNRPRKNVRQRQTLLSTRAMAEAGEHLQRDGADGEDQAVADDLAEGVVVDQVDVVAQADEPLGIADQLVGEGQPDGPVERIDDEGHHHDEQRQQEEEGRAEVAPGPPAARRPAGRSRREGGSQRRDARGRKLARPSRLPGRVAPSPRPACRRSP